MGCSLPYIIRYFFIISTAAAGYVMKQSSVCVVGAGPAGLAAMRSLIECGDKVSITTYEQSNVLGGLWV